MNNDKAAKFTAMVISPHADDAAAFCGGTLAKFAESGWKVVLVRVTDDCRDSVGLSVKETVKRARKELQAAARHLGVSELVELGFPTDSLADVPLGKLRERIVYHFRKFRPYAVFSFDPYAPFENNLDHLRTAQAVEEAYWVSCFDLHYPQHLKKGLKPFSVCERWYFAREMKEPNQIEDITEQIGKKTAALLSHETAMKNLLNQFKLQLDTWGRSVPLIEFSLNTDMKPLLEGYLAEQAKSLAKQHGLAGGRMAEVFRLVRFGDLEGLFQILAQPIPGAPEPPKRAALDVTPKKE